MSFHKNFNEWNTFYWLRSTITNDPFKKVVMSNFQVVGSTYLKHLLFSCLHSRYSRCLVWFVLDYSFKLYLSSISIRMVTLVHNIASFKWAKWIFNKQWPLNSEFCEFCEYSCKYLQMHFWHVSCWCCDSPDSPTFTKLCRANLASLANLASVG